MKRFGFIIFVMLSCVLSAESIAVYTSPKGGVEARLIELINGETKKITVCVYQFTNRRIAKALGNAKSRGVDVKVIVDGNDLRFKGAINILEKQNVPVFFFPKNTKTHAIMHHKLALFESSSTYVSGSYNWTYKAENVNQEHIIVVSDDKENYEKFESVVKQIVAVTQKEDTAKLK